jgi:hypothetical protein
MTEREWVEWRDRRKVQGSDEPKEPRGEKARDSVWGIQRV